MNQEEGPKKKIAVLVIDDSAVVRQVMTEVLSSEPDIEVIATASDPIFAMEKMKRRWPDVITLDMEMPRMDGLTFLRKLMAERPTPVIVCSTLTEQGAQLTLDALGAGAVEVITKAKMGVRDFLQESGLGIRAAVRAAARANMRRVRAGHAGALPVPAKLSADAILPAASGPGLHKTTECLVAIGTSTGGTQALDLVLSALPRVCAGLVIVQHMPEKFTAAFAERLNQRCQMEVKEAQDGDRVRAGRALIAPGGKHLLVRRSGAQYFAEVRDGPPVNRHRPSVDVLFRSAAKAAGKNALGVIMTGMGDDGAAGLLEMRNAGAHTVAESADTCVVFGMPKEAIKRGAAEQVLPLDHIPAAIQRFFASWGQGL